VFRFERSTKYLGRMVLDLNAFQDVFQTVKKYTEILFLEKFRIFNSFTVNEVVNTICFFLKLQPIHFFTLDSG